MSVEDGFDPTHYSIQEQTNPVLVENPSADMAQSPTAEKVPSTLAENQSAVYEQRLNDNLKMIGDLVRQGGVVTTDSVEPLPTDYIGQMKPSLEAGLTHPQHASETMATVSSMSRDSRLASVAATILTENPEAVVAVFTDASPASRTEIASTYASLMKRGVDRLKGVYFNHILPGIIEDFSQGKKANDQYCLCMVAEHGTVQQIEQVSQALREQLRQQPDHTSSINAWLLSENPEIVQRAVDLMGATLQDAGLDPALIEKWQSIVDGAHFPNQQRESIYRNWAAALTLEQQQAGSVAQLQKQFGILHVGRYDTGTLLDQLNQPPQPGESYGVAIYPYADHNDVLNNASIYRGLSADLKGNDQKLVVFECANQLDVVSALNKSRKAYGKISFMIMGGHGQPDGILFGGTVAPDGTDQHTSREMVNESDVLRPGALAIKNAFIEHPQVVLVSCSTGARDGIAQAMSDAFGAEVIAPDRPINIEAIRAVGTAEGTVRLLPLYQPRAAEQDYDNGQPVQLRSANEVLAA